jgi:phospholipid/cholesterol/gamma-HCH transport system substrate-binding protein
MNWMRTAGYGLLAAAVAAIAIVLLSSGGGGYIVRAEFRDLGGLRKDSSVKIGGVTGGTVSSIAVTKRDTAIATFTLDSNAAPVGAGATVQVRPTDLLGERYAQLTVGNLSQPQPSGALITIQRTSTPVELDDVLNTFNVDTRTRLRILINEAGIATTGRGADFSRLLYALPPNLDQARQLLAQVASQNHTLSNLIVEGDRITAAVNGKRDQLGNLINNAQGALAAVASRQAQLATTMQAAPGALTQLRTALDQVGTAADSITPAAVNLTNAAAPLSSTLSALPAFASSAHATLLEARAVAPDLERLATRARGPLATLRPTAAALQDVSAQSTPILTELDQRAMKDVLLFVENWALGMKARDAFGHFVGANLFVDPSVITSALQAYLNVSSSNAAADRRRSASAIRQATPATPPAASTGSGSAAPASKPNLLNQLGGLVSATQRSLSSTLGGVISGVGKLTSGLLPHQPPPSGPPPNSPGNTQQSRAQSLLDYLLRP